MAARKLQSRGRVVVAAWSCVALNWFSYSADVDAVTAAQRLL